MKSFNCSQITVLHYTFRIIIFIIYTCEGSEGNLNSFIRHQLSKNARIISLKFEGNCKLIKCCGKTQFLLPLKMLSIPAPRVRPHRPGFGPYSLGLIRLTFLQALLFGTFSVVFRAFSTPRQCHRRSQIFMATRRFFQCRMTFLAF